MENELLAPTSRFAEFNRRTLIGVVLTGIVAGILTLVLSRVFDQFIISPALCRSAAESVCTNSPAISFHIASILAGIVGVVMLVNLSVYRPLLVAIAVNASLWSLHSAILSGKSWWIALLALATANALAYLAFTWMLRMYNLVIALILTIVLVIASLFVLGL